MPLGVGMSGILACMGSGWELTIQLVTAVATVGAVTMAWSSARSSRAAARSAAEAVQFEQRRAREEAEAELLRQPRQVLVDLTSGDVLNSEGQVALDCWCRVTNGSTQPIKRVRIRFGTDDAQWGPQLLGNLAPGATRTILARIYLRDAPIGSFSASARFVDARDESWIVTSGGQLAPDSADGLNRWIEDGKKTSNRAVALTDAERGIVLEVDFQEDIQKFRSTFGLSPTLDPTEQLVLSTRVDSENPSSTNGRLAH